jgi:prepilin-type N-terminal cleavage/methylation domain-containing protein
MKIKNCGFSLTEVLMAAGILSIGIMLVATMFPAALYLTSTASEKTMAAIVADEAFAKMQLYGNKLNKNDPCVFDRYWETMADKIHEDEYTYPSFSGNTQYAWVPLCKKLNNDSHDMRYLVKVYVSRKTSPNQRFYKTWALSDVNTAKWPIPLDTDADLVSSNQLRIPANEEKKEVFSPPPSTTIIDSMSGRVFRVIKREGNVLTLDRNWDEDIPKTSIYIWYLPASVGSQTGPKNKAVGKNPDIEVFQKIIDFGKK